MTGIHDLIEMLKRKQLGMDDYEIVAKIQSALDRRPDLRRQLSLSDLAWLTARTSQGSILRYDNAPKILDELLTAEGREYILAELATAGIVGQHALDAIERVEKELWNKSGG